jgi:IS4 transposase
MKLRRVEARVEVDGEWRVMVFITNNTTWSPRSVCDLYRRRWDIEVFFKQVKQSLKLGSFLGHSANAVKWQVYTALLVYVLLRYMAHQSEWGHSFTRLFAVTRSALWERIDLLALLKSYGTASGRFKVIGALNTAWLPGFAPTRT